MTIPVLTKMNLLEDNMINKKMCFYFEKKHQDSPPDPVDEDVTIETNKDMTVLVHTFGGYDRIKVSYIFCAIFFAGTL